MILKHIKMLCVSIFYKGITGGIYYAGIKTPYGLEFLEYFRGKYQ